MRLPRIQLTVPIALAALAMATPGSAEAQDYDMDCKLLLCLPGGFPDGCGDALDHMIDRLRDGKSPIGSCAMPNGEGFDDYQIDYSFNRTTSRKGWNCPEGSSLYHSVSRETGRPSVSTFCYEDRESVRIGSLARYYYIGRSIPQRTDMTLSMTFQPGSDGPYETGDLKVQSGFVQDWGTQVSYSERSSGRRGR